MIVSGLLVLRMAEESRPSQYTKQVKFQSYKTPAMMWLFAIIYNIHNTFVAVNYILLTMAVHP